MNEDMILLLLFRVERNTSILTGTWHGYNSRGNNICHKGNKAFQMMATSKKATKCKGYEYWWS